MKIFKVDIQKVDYYTGIPQNWELIGYYTNKATAEKAKDHALDNRFAGHYGKTRIEEIIVDES